MMTDFIFCMFLLVNAVAGLLSVSVAALTLKSSCPGDSVQAFQNIKFDRCNAVVSLIIIGERNTRIATWSMNNCTLNATFLPDYKERVFLDQTGAISIRNIHHFDQGKYIVVSLTDTLPMIHEVEISVMVAPTKDCKPKIVRLGNSLFATLKANDCGTPVATLYWKDNAGVSRTKEGKLKLTPGKEAGTYYACIEGPALDCVRNLTPQDYCNSITIEGSDSVIMETRRTTVYIVLAAGITFIFIMATAVTMILVRKSRRNKKLNEKQLRRNHFDPENKKEEASNRYQVIMDSETMKELQELCHAPRCKSCLGNKMRVAVIPCYHID